MGLGKTIQALGIAHYYKEDWPLLIVSPSSVRYAYIYAYVSVRGRMESNGLIR